MERCYMQFVFKNRQKSATSVKLHRFAASSSSAKIFFFLLEIKCRMKSIHLSVNGLASPFVPSAIYINVFAVMKKFFCSASSQCSSYAKGNDRFNCDFSSVVLFPYTIPLSCAASPSVCCWCGCWRIFNSIYLFASKCLNYIATIAGRYQRYSRNFTACAQTARF